MDRVEYSWSSTSDGVCSAPNRSQDLRSCVGVAGLEIFPRRSQRNGAEAPWKLVLRTLSFGGEDEARALGEPSFSRSGNRVDLDYGVLREWYVNDERGLEQGWTIPARPANHHGTSLRIEVETRGLHAQIAADGGSAVFVDTGADTRVCYDGLRAKDATERELPARLLPTSAGFAVLVAVEHARYPITVDPVLGGPPWTLECNQERASFGCSVSGAGDVNGDGFDDVIVGAYEFDHGQPGEGRAFLYLGSASGLSATPDWTGESDQAYAWFGTSVSGAGDVNGDGFDDVIVGAERFDNGQTDEGRSFLYVGSASGLSLAPAWMAESNQPYSYFGTSVSGAGDVNGDGFEDVVVGADRFDLGQTDEGRAYLYLGSAGGPSPTPDWTAESDQDFAYFGGSVSGAGDVNGDGFDDVIVGAEGFEQGHLNEGRAFLYLGSAGGLSPSPNWKAELDQIKVAFGHCVSGAGDVNGDGFDDVIVGAPYYENGQAVEGGAFLFLGSPTVPSVAPDWKAEGDQPSALFGTSVSGAGDVNGDGFHDVIVGAERFDGGETDEGRAFLYLGSAGGPALAPDWTAEADQWNAYFGSSVSGAGDVDGDGLDDVIVGALQFDNGMLDEGRAYVYLACPSGGATYCVSTANSSGGPAEISAWCSESSATGHLTLLAQPVPNSFGMFFHGMSQSQIPFGNGFLCASGDIVRGALIHASESAAVYRYDNSDAAHSLTAHVGTTRNFQYWFRDPLGFPAFFNTSNAVSIAILP
jgi:hypothetical protein